MATRKTRKRREESRDVTHLAGFRRGSAVCGAFHIDVNIRTTADLIAVTCKSCLAEVRTMRKAVAGEKKTYRVTAHYVANTSFTVEAYNQSHAETLAESRVEPHVNLCHHCAQEFGDDPVLDTTEVQQDEA